MGYLTPHIAQLVIWLGALIVLISAMVRFNNPQVLLSKPEEDKNWLDFIKHSLRLNPGEQNLLIRPARANTTLFRYRLYQCLYALLAVLIYMMLFMPGIAEQINSIIGWFTPDHLPNLKKAEPLVIAAFVILIFPNVPPFRWADIKIRSLLYERALIPAQQLREMHRLKMAEFIPSRSMIEYLQKIAVTDGFDASDIAYDSQIPTTQSLWTKCIILIEQIKLWEADDLYKTAFASLKEPDSEVRSVDYVKEIQQNLVADARVCFAEMRACDDEKSEELINREDIFRSNCRTLLEKTYTLLAGVSLHSHYSDRDRIIQFDKIGFQLKAGVNGPIPDSNDMLILTLIVCAFLVLPLTYKLGFVKALMIGAIMFSAVLTPIVLAHVCPGMRNAKPDQRTPNVLYPLLSGILAAFLGFMIFLIASQFIKPSTYCNFTGYEIYTHCTYPFSFLHSGIAILLAIRISTGKYPNIKLLHGIQRYRQWGSIKDGIICAVCMFIIVVALVKPELDAIRNSTSEGWDYWGMPIRISLISFVLGFIVPTWYHAHNQPFIINRRKDPKERDRFNQTLSSIQLGVREG